jgi:hypothetical protein
MATSRALHILQNVLLAIARQHRRMSEKQRRSVAILVSVFVAFLLWFTFSMREQYSVVVEMPVEIVRVPEGRALASLPPPQARVTVQGVGWELLKLRRNPPALALSAEDDQIDVFAAASENPRLPPGLSVQSVAPSTLRLELEPEVTRTVPIDLQWQVQPAPLYDFLGPPRISPDSVRVTGARRIVNAIESFPTQPLQLDDVRQTVAVRVPLADTLRGLVRAHATGVDVTIPVGLFTEASRQLDIQIEDMLPGAPTVVLLPPRVRVTFRIPVEQYDRALMTPDMYAFIPYSIIAADTTGSLAPTVNRPSNLAVRDIRVEPRRVRYRLRID